MKPKLLISAFTLLFAISGCSVYSVLYTDHSQNVNFWAYKTFAWLPSDDNDTTENTPYHNQIIESNTKNYFTHEFLARGMTVHLDTPDVLMQLVIKAVNKQKTEQVPVSAPVPNQYYNNSYYRNPYTNPYNNPYNYNPYNYPATSPQNPYYTPYPNQYNYNFPFNNITNYGYVTQTVDYTQSTITLNIIDRKLNKMVWTTTVEGDLYDPDEMQNNLHPAVLRILDSYPVKPIKPAPPKKGSTYSRFK